MLHRSDLIGRPHPTAYPALLLNADDTPVSIYPLKTLAWQDALKSVMLDRVDVLAEHDAYVSTAGQKLQRLPAVIRMRVAQDVDRTASFTRIGIYTRDRFRCAYCGDRFPMKKLTFDHVHPASKGGLTAWDNIITACADCNLRKANRSPEAAGMPLLWEPYAPSLRALNDIAREFPINRGSLHAVWLPYLNLPEMNETQMLASQSAFPSGMTDAAYWNAELES